MEMLLSGRVAKVQAAACAEALRLAMKHGYGAVADALLANGALIAGLTPRSCVHLLASAAMNGFTALVERLCADASFTARAAWDREGKPPSAKRARASYDDDDDDDYNDDDEEDEDDDGSGSGSGARAGHDDEDDDDEDHPLLIAAKAGHSAAVEALLRLPSIRASSACGHALAAASFKDDMACVKLLLAVESVNPTAGRNAAFRAVARAGDLPLLQELLADARADPAAAGNTALCAAAKTGHLHVVEWLLADPRVDPSYRKSPASRAGAACIGSDGELTVENMMGFAKAFRAVLGHDDTTADHCAVELAAKHGHLAVLDRLLADPRIDPAVCHSSALNGAAEHGQMATVERLLADGRSPASRGFDGSIIGKKPDILNRMLAEPEADPGQYNNRCVRRIAEDGNVEMLELLLADPRVDAIATGDKGKDALQQTITSWQGRSNAHAALRLLHQPCVLRSRLLALPWTGELAELRVSADSLTALAWRRRCLVIAAAERFRVQAGLPSLAEEARLAEIARVLAPKPRA